MKRTFAFMMALVLVLSLSIGAFAAGTGSITITNAVPEKTYKLYKIFDATYKDSNVTYTIKPGDEFFDDMFGDGTAPNEYFEYHAATGVVTKKDGVNDSDLFTYLSGLIKEDTTVVATETAAPDSTTVKFTDLDFGYYLIKRTDDSANAVTITTAKPTAQVNDKNAGIGGDFDKSTDDTAVSVGDTITWTVSFTATNYAKGEKVLNYTVKDALEQEWAAIDFNNITITVNGAPISKGAGWTMVSGSPSGFEIDIPWATLDAEDNFVSFLYPATSDVEITYSAVVLDAAAANDPASSVNKNKAELKYDTETKPDQPGGDDVTETDVFNMGFTKVDGTSGNPLAGATFALYSDNACTVPVKVSAVDGKTGVYIVDPEGTNSVVTPAGGAVVIQGLAAGKYYLKETDAPAGYNKLDTVQEVEVGKGGTDVLTVGGVDYTVSNAEINIENFSGVELPSTGGEGTMMMITIGTMVAMAFAVLMITQKKMSIYQD